MTLVTFVVLILDKILYFSYSGIYIIMMHILLVFPAFLRMFKFCVLNYKRITVRFLTFTKDIHVSIVTAIFYGKPRFVGFLLDSHLSNVME